MNIHNLREGLCSTPTALAADEEADQAVVASRVTAIATRRFELPDGSLSVTPMSEVAAGWTCRSRPHCWRSRAEGVANCSAIPGVLPADVVIIGGGSVGTNAAMVALGMGAAVLIVDIVADRLRYLTEVLHGNLKTLVSSPRNVAEAVRRADAVIGAVLVKGAKAPRLVTREMIATMKSGSVVVDVAVDQGGCVETTRPTSHSQPTLWSTACLHYCVPIFRAAVPRTSPMACRTPRCPTRFDWQTRASSRQCERTTPRWPRESTPTRAR